MKRFFLLVAALLCAASAAAADPALNAARATLAASERAAAEARLELEAERRAGLLQGRALQDFEAYVQGLDFQVSRHRHTVDWLAAQAAGRDPGPAPETGDPSPFEYAPAHTVDERISALDARLGASLGEFDEMLLREREELARRIPRAASGGGAGGGAGAGDRNDGQNDGQNDGNSAGEGGGESAAGGGWANPDRPETGAEGEQSMSGAPGAAGESGEPARAGGSEQVAAAGGRHGRDPGQGVATGRPPDLPDGRDDDIVARQIREAAEQATDAALKRKLWDEYRRYKNGTR